MQIKDGTIIALYRKYILHPILPIHGPAIPPQTMAGIFFDLTTDIRMNIFLDNRG